MWATLLIAGRRCPRWMFAGLHCLVVRSYPEFAGRNTDRELQTLTLIVATICGHKSPWSSNSRRLSVRPCEALAAMRRHGESRSDWARVAATTDAELEASIAADPDEAHDADWSRTVVGIPARKRDIHIRIDADVRSWFRGTGKGYQSRINNVLRAFVESRKHTSGPR
jgi:uncharacterized protein (DUF4415 family)